MRLRSSCPARRRGRQSGCLYRSAAKIHTRGRNSKTTQTTSLNNPSHLTRRQFLESTGKGVATLAAVSAAAPSILSAPSPNKTIGVGCIGIGTRGGGLINSAAAVPGVKVVAVSDVYQPHLRKGVERSKNPDVKSCVDYRELLADKNVDAVAIGTPDHWHCQMVLDAVSAGKDIYCEKGFSRTLAEAKRMRDALRRSRVVFQLGHQARQSTAALQAKDPSPTIWWISSIASEAGAPPNARPTRLSSRPSRASCRSSLTTGGGWCGGIP
ncbi:MAG: Gfo/Idh/MocA family oxidoreductase [Verrucomicrobia bacterium]|nr:Gfo/Idh/MocA family oxidoreductase [Verrucomicrobiota bacterium]